MGESAGPLNIQPMPDLTPAEYEALRSDIAANGVIYPVIVDQNGRIIDGNNRASIADELGIEYQREVRVVRNDDEAVDLAVRLNCQRRHLNREQVRQIIASWIARRPDDSDRAIARRVGCDHKTVGTVRGGEIPHLATMTVEEAENLTRKLQHAFGESQKHLLAGVMLALSAGITRAEIVMALMTHRQREAQEHSDLAPVTEAVFDPVLKWVLDPENTDEFWNRYAAPFTSEEKEALLALMSGETS